MRRIVKTQIPPLLAGWVTQTQDGLNSRYEQLTAATDVKNQLRERLIKEQYFLCAYTGLDISGSNFHVEHLYPRHLSRQNGTREDVDYFNMLACYPSAEYKENCYFGANKKDKWWDASKFVSPLLSNCEVRFGFNWSGKISTNSSDAVAKSTVEVLSLDHSQLTSLRKAAIDGFFGFSSGTAISKPQARKLLTKIDQPEGGKLRPFCFVLKQLLEKYVA
jgi:uncharacterized protein (TIGR02646 family)